MLKLDNICRVVRESLTLAGYAHYKVLLACNRTLASVPLKKEAEEKTGKASYKVSKKGDGTFNMSLRLGTEKYQVKGDKVNIVHQFLAWHQMMHDASEIFPCFSVTLSDSLKPWLDKFAKADKEGEKESNLTEKEVSDAQAIVVK